MVLLVRNLLVRNGCVLLLLGACAPEEEEEATDPCLPGDGPSLVVGHGELEYMDVDGATAAELVHGPQGGYHVNIALEATYLDASLAWETLLEGWIDGELVGETRPYATMRCNAGSGVLQTWGLLLIWDAEPEDLHDQVATVDVTLADSAGTEITATNELLIWDPNLE